MWPLSVLLALLRAGTPKAAWWSASAGPMEEEFSWERGGGRTSHCTNGEGIRTTCLKESSSDFPTCHPLSHSQNPENSVNTWVIQSNGKNTKSVVHGDSSALGLNLNVGCVQIRGICEFWWENETRRFRDYYMYTCVKKYFVVHVRNPKCEKHIGGCTFLRLRI